MGSYMYLSIINYYYYYYY